MTTKGDFNYEVTHDGRVFSIDSNWRGYGRREMVQTLNSYGYPSVRITVGGRRKHVAVHALVARTHLGPQPAPGYEIRHLDGNKLNNDFRNLAWGSQKDNADDRSRHGRTSHGEAHSASIKASKHRERVKRGADHYMARAAIAKATGESHG